MYSVCSTSTLFKNNVFKVSVFWLCDRLLEIPKSISFVLLFFFALVM